MAKNKTRYGIWQEETKRYGLCWRYDIRVLDYAGNVRRKTGSGFPTKAECEMAVSKLRLESRENKYGLARPNPPKVITINEVTENYIAALTGRWASKYGQEYVQKNIGQINAVRKWADFVGRNKDVLKLTKRDLTNWSQSEMERGLKSSSVKRRYNSIRAVLNYAREEFEELNSFTAPKISFGQEAISGRIRTLSYEEIKKLGEAFRSKREWQDVYDFFRVALGSGGRFDEIMPVVVRKDKKAAGIKWTDISEQNQTITLFSFKTGKTRIIRVPAVIKILLERKSKNLGTPLHVFDQKDHFIRNIFKKVSKDCGIAYGRKTPNG